jgi:hypothetical protein
VPGFEDAVARAETVLVHYSSRDGRIPGSRPVFRRI